jgi:hypothetical protein
MNKAVLAAILLSSAAAAAQPSETVIVIQPGTQPVTVSPLPPSGPGAMPPSAPPGPMVAQPAPQNYDWNNVSHINGTPVPVGDVHEYLYTLRKTNISSNPVGWILGFYGVSVSYALSNNVAIRGDLNYMSPTDSNTTGAELGIGLPIYLRRTYQGPFIEPGLITRTFTNHDTYGGSDSSSTTAGPQMLVGWHWMYDSGLNLAIALGAGRNFSSNQSSSSYSEDEPFVNGYFRVGYAF